MQRKLLFIAVPIIVGIAVAMAFLSTYTQTEPLDEQTESMGDQTEPLDEQTNSAIPDFEYELRKITIHDVPLTVEIADDPEKTALGLMYREGMPEDQGMLFIFERERIHQFWMMNMKFNLDILWLDSDGKVVHIVEHAEPCISEALTSLCTYRPDAPAKYVLEVNSGFVEKYGINENSTMKFVP